MPSLAEAYEPDAGYQASRRQLALGAGLFLLGVTLVVGGIVAVSTDVLADPGGYYTTARLYGGVLAGLGVPAAFLGVFAVLPASRATRGTAVIGASIAVVGVALFWHAYPCQWVGTNCANGRTILTLPTVAVYFLGILVTLSCLFTGVANFKARNDPRGTVTREVVTKGETKVVEVPSERGGLGGVGLLGGTPDGNVETQTNRSTAGGQGATASDGGATEADLTFPNDGRTAGREKETRSATSPPPSAARPASSSPTGPTEDATVERRTSERTQPQGDTYCGSCAHFRYAKDGESGSMVPYCTRHAEPLDDMTACEEWTARTNGR